MTRVPENLQPEAGHDWFRPSTAWFTPHISPFGFAGSATAMDPMGLFQDQPWAWYESRTAQPESSAAPPYGFSPQPGPWFEDVIERILELGALERGWDAYDGEPPAARHVSIATRFLLAVMQSQNMQLPEIAPLADGGIQLEWANDEVDVEFITDDEEPGPMLLVTQAGQEPMELRGQDLVEAALTGMLGRSWRGPSTVAELSGD